MTVFICAPLVVIWAFLTSFSCLRRQGLLIIVEVTVESLMLLATAIITKQQSAILDSVFNFVGLLLILELDELAVKTTSFTIKVVTFSTPVIRDNDKTRAAVSIWIFVGLLIYLLV